MFLEQRDAEGLLKDGLQFVLRMFETWFGRFKNLGWVVLLFLATFKVRFYHSSLNWAGPHQRYFDHQVVEIARSQAWQHVHLGAAFHLEDANGVSFAQHIVNAGIFFRHVV